MAARWPAEAFAIIGSAAQDTRAQACAAAEGGREASKTGRGTEAWPCQGCSRTTGELSVICAIGKHIYVAWQINTGTVYMTLDGDYEKLDRDNDAPRMESDVVLPKIAVLQ